MAEDYAAKMGRKTDAELRQYVDHYPDYQEEAVLAAIDELERRGREVAQGSAVRTQLETIVQEQRQQEIRQQEIADQAAAAQAEASTGPTLYSPGTITLFSALFSLLAGGVLLGINLRVLRRSAAIVPLILFIIVYLVAGGMILKLLIDRFGFSPWIGAFFDLPAIILYIVWFWPRYIRTTVYQSRNWLVPFVIFMAIKMGLAFLLMPYMQQLASNMGVL